MPYHISNLILKSTDLHEGHVDTAPHQEASLYIKWKLSQKVTDGQDAGINRFEEHGTTDASILYLFFVSTAQGTFEKSLCSTKHNTTKPSVQ